MLVALVADTEEVLQHLAVVLAEQRGVAADAQRALAEAGVALHLHEAETVAGALWAAMTDLARDDRRMASMARTARERGQPDAAADIVAALTALLPRGPRSVTVSGEAA